MVCGLQVQETSVHVHNIKSESCFRQSNRDVKRNTGVTIKTGFDSYLPTGFHFQGLQNMPVTTHCCVIDLTWEQLWCLSKRTMLFPAPGGTPLELPQDLAIYLSIPTDSTSLILDGGFDSMKEVHI